MALKIPQKTTHHETSILYKTYPMPSPEEQKLLLYTSNVHKKREEQRKETTLVENAASEY